MNERALWRLKKGAKVRATRDVVGGDDDKVYAQPGDVGEVVEPSKRGAKWPTVQFEGGATIVFEDEVELAQ